MLRFRTVAEVRPVTVPEKPETNADGNVRISRVKRVLSHPVSRRVGVLGGLCATLLSSVVLPPAASADVCGSVGGRFVSVSGCGNVADAIAPWVPPPAG